MFRLTRSLERRQSSGFSLIEVIAALFILSVGILAVAQLFSTTLRSVERGDRHSRAATYARSLLEEAYAMDDLEQADGAFEFMDGFSATREIRELSVEELDVSEREVALYEILVVIAWPPSGRLEMTGVKLFYEKPE